jgi:RNA polymerase sigma factor (sigma-70 family)
MRRLANVLQSVRDSSTPKLLERSKDQSKHTQWSDQVLLSRFIASDDHAAFCEITRRHGSMVLRICHRLLGNCHDAEDATQKVFLLLARRPKATIGSLGSWLCKVARDTSIEMLRSRSSRRKREVLACQSSPIMEVAASTEWREELDAALVRLPAPMLDAIVACYLEGWTQAEAARMLGCNQGTLSRRLTQGLERLRVILAQRGVVLGSGTVVGLLADLSVSAIGTGSSTVAIPAATGSFVCPLPTFSGFVGMGRWLVHKFVNSLFSSLVLQWLSPLFLVLGCLTLELLWSSCYAPISGPPNSRGEDPMSKNGPTLQVEALEERMVPTVLPSGISYQLSADLKTLNITGTESKDFINVFGSEGQVLLQTGSNESRSAFMATYNTKILNVAKDCRIIVHGKGGDDQIINNSTFYTELYGDAGNDIVQNKGMGLAGGIVDGGSGDNQLYVGWYAYNCRVIGGAGNDTIDVRNATAKITGGGGNDKILWYDPAPTRSKLKSMVTDWDDSIGTSTYLGYNLYSGKQVFKSVIVNE